MFLLVLVLAIHLRMSAWFYVLYTVIMIWKILWWYAKQRAEYIQKKEEDKG